VVVGLCSSVGLKDWLIVLVSWSGLLCWYFGCVAGLGSLVC